MDRRLFTVVSVHYCSCLHVDMAKFTVLQLIHRRDSSALLRCTVLVSVRCVQVVNAFLLSLRSEQNLQAAEHVYVFPSYLAVLWDRQIFNQWMLSSVRSFTLRLTMAYFTTCSYCVRSLMIPYQFQPQITGSSVADSRKDVPLVILLSISGTKSPQYANFGGRE